MPTREERAYLKQFFRRLHDRPLDYSKDQDRKMYQPLHDEENDPVTRLFDNVEMSLDASLQLLAGFRGTGKTTEFSRLEKQLWEAGYPVVRVDLDHYVDRHSPVDIRELLLILAGAIGEQVSAPHLLGERHGKEGAWGRLKEFLSREITLSEGSMDLGPASLKLALKEQMTFRDRVRAAFRDKVPRLAELVWEHHRQTVQAIRRRLETDNPLVVIVDSFEHIRGDRENFGPVYRSVEELFFYYGRYLSFPDTHVIMSVHPFVALQADRLVAELVNGAVQAWPACHVRHRDGSIDREALERMVQLVEARGDWRRVLPDRASLEKLVLASGGYVRDLLRFMGEGVHQAMRGIREDVASRIINVVKRAYLPLFKDEIELLQVIVGTRNLSGVDSSQLDQVHRFLDSHLLLCYLNDDFWYDVHPMIKSELSP